MHSGRTEAWFESLPDLWQQRALRIRELILDASPAMSERIRYGSPFYDHRSWLAYLSLQKGCLVLGFIQGKHLIDPDGLLERTDHRLIRHYLPPHPPTRMDEQALRRLIAEAVLVNEELAGKRRGNTAHKARFFRKQAFN